MVKKRQTDVHENGSSTDTGDEENHQAGGATNLSSGSASACQHIKKSVDATKLRRQLKLTGLLYECSQCQKMKSGGDAAPDPSASFEYDNTLWLCLKCGTQLCGRARNQHALQHYQTPHSDSHSLAMNTRSFVIWCYECDNEVSSNSRKNLLECVELVKRLAQKPPTGLTNASVAPTSPSESPPPPTTISNIESKIKTALKQIGPMVPMTGGQQQQQNQKEQHQLAIPLPPPPPVVVPGMAKRVGVVGTGVASAATAGAKRGDVIINKVGGAVEIDRLPSVRGLTNLGNTCFFNAVMQCLAQTPFLLSVLKELSEPGEEFVLPGGSFSFKDKGNIELPMIRGTLSSWGGLTAALANALEELQGRGGVFTPSKLFDKLCSKCPQFTGGDQHDAHELLRQLLESVRNEDLKRYQRVILQNLGYKDQDINSVSEEMRQKCKIYGNQAGDRILRPEQVFRGFLVSTLTCQDCFNISSRHEYFLDMSLPVAVEKPQPPQRRKPSPENNAVSMTTSSTNTSNLSPNPNQINAKFNSASNGGIYQADDGDDAKQPFFLHTKNDEEQQQGPTKSQLKKEKERERKANRAAKHQRHKQAQKLALKVNGNANGEPGTEPTAGGGDAASAALLATTTNDDDDELPREADTLSSSVTTSEHSDADVEDNLQEDTTTTNTATTSTSTTTTAQAKFYTDKNGNAQPAALVGEKRDDTPDHMDKDSLEEDENDSGIATSPAPTTIITSNATAPTNNGNATSSSSMSTSATSRADDECTAASLVTAGLSEKGASLIRQISIGNGTTNGMSAAADPNGIQLAAAQLEQLKLGEQAAQSGGALGGSGGGVRSKRVRTQSYSDWSTTIAPRYQCEDGECSVQSCLNNFTAVELMTGQNKVGCESCTKRLNGPDPQAKSVNTNATKQLLISSPPAVLILHLKRFQLGPRCIFRKLTRPVTYPMLLDVAAFCGSKVKNLPNIDRKQKKLLYALYGVVEHSGGMYGGHYTAFVKVRPKLMPDDKRWKFLPHGSKAELDQDDDQLKKLEELMAKEKAREMRINAMDDSDDFTNSSSNSSTCDEGGQGPGPGPSAMPLIDDDAASMGAGDMGGIGETTARTTKTGAGADLPQDEAAHIQAPPGKWYYVSDSRVQEVSEETALKAQAYLLFYERIY
ncbi:LOW QUALITY PROTEIN: ubiquitin carboxyl-terminal hydrolase 16/45 [Drosophila tropicalis]|uniref:LOW QUALITY PROTEIN: ubiquitin carboxyl-terminal hydrolase 16/45 n=1 Tax=Drosophila tropicalis TaxID=46794 RepID=UPI0035ABC589